MRAVPRGLGWLCAGFLIAALSGCATPPADDVQMGAGAPAAVASAPAAPIVTKTSPIAAPTAAPDTLQANGQPYLFAIDPLRPSVIVEGDDANARSDLWVRVRAGFAIPDLDNPLVIKWQQWYASRPDYVQRMTERGSRYLFYVIEEIDKRGMPTELALLPFIESAFNPQAMSVARASGMWQFMPATGKDFDLKQNLFRDDRRDVLASTRAALDYLQKLHDMFGDWHLALAAYNWGQGNVKRAIERNQAAGLGTGYLDLKMPAETRNYVPKLQAVKNIIAQPQHHGAVLPLIENHPFFDTVEIKHDIDVDMAARLAQVRLEDFKALNPSQRKPVIFAAGTPQVLLPYDNATLFVKNLRAHKAPLATWTAWVAPATLKPADAARQVGMSEEQLRSVNRIPPRMLVKAGSTLLVSRSPHKNSDVSSQVADNAMILLAPDRPPGRRVSFKAGKKGDPVAAVARRNGVSIEQVAQWNGVGTDARFRPGQTIVLIKPAAPAKAGKRTATAPTQRATAAAKAPAKRTAASKPAAKPTSKVATAQGDSKL